MSEATGRRAAADDSDGVSLWRNRDFMLLWSGQLFSNLGSTTSGLAIPLLVLALTGSPAHAGALGTAVAALRLLCQLPAGAIADRGHRRVLMMLSDGGRAFLLAGLGVAVLVGTPPLALVYVVALTTAVLDTAFQPAERAALSRLVPVGQLPRAAAQNEARTYAASLAGPPLGGALFAVASAAPFLFDGVSYVASLLAVRAIGTPLEGSGAPGPPGTLGREIREGIHHVLASRFLRSLLLIAAPLNFAVGIAVFAIVVVLREAGHSSTAIGAAVAVIGLSGLVGAVAAPRLQRLGTFRSLLVAATAGLTVSIAAAALLSGELAMVLPLAAGLFLAPAVNASLFARLAETTPDHLQGRVYSAVILAATAVAALAPVIAGVVIEHAGGSAALAAATLVTLVALGTAILSSGLTDAPSSTHAAGRSSKIRRADDHHRRDDMGATIEGPVTGGTHGRPWGSPLFDLATVGYVEEEWFLQGEATTYELAAGTEATVDGRWHAEPSGAIPYRTRMVVRRPADPGAFNGTVVVSWNNVSAGFEILQWEGPETFEGGFVTVGVSAQRVGLNGYKADPRGLVAWDPERYGSLSIPSDAASYEIFAAAIRAVAPGAAERVLPGFDVRRLVATGASQSAARLHTYFNAVHPHVGLVDGFVFDVYAGNGAPIARASAEGLAPYSPGHLRDDTGARVFLTNSETEAVRFAPLRRPDDDHFVYWEIAGMAHGGASGLVTAAKNERDWGFPLGAPVQLPADLVPNELDKQPVEDASLHWMQGWLTEGVRPPPAPPIEVAGEPLDVRRDAHGIALGGLRLPQVEVPVAALAGLNDGDRMAQLVGSAVPFPAARLKELYGDRATYLERFGAAADAAVAAGHLLPRDAAAMVRDAEAVAIG